MGRLPMGIAGSIAGRSTLLTDPAMRGFAIEKPRRESSASQSGHGAHSAWAYEGATPPLDRPLSLTAARSKALEEYADAVPGSDTAYSLEARSTIAELEDRFVESTGCLYNAAHAYISYWGAFRDPTTLTPGGLSTFNGWVRPDLMSYVLGVASFGG